MKKETKEIFWDSLGETAKYVTIGLFTGLMVDFHRSTYARYVQPKLIPPCCIALFLHTWYSNTSSIPFQPTKAKIIPLKYVIDHVGNVPFFCFA